MSASPDDIEALLELFASSRWSEMHLAIDGLELTLSNDPAFEMRSAGTPPVSAANVASTPSAVPAAPAPPGTAAGTSAASPASHAAAASSGPGAEERAGFVAIRAPNLGHFYRAPKPGAPPFVDVGSRVAAEDTVCVIEVMKLFTLLAAGVSGTVRRICVEDAALVEFDQPLFYVEPDA